MWAPGRVRDLDDVVDRVELWGRGVSAASVPLDGLNLVLVRRVELGQDIRDVDPHEASHFEGRRVPVNADELPRHVVKPRGEQLYGVTATRGGPRSGAVRAHRIGARVVGALAALDGAPARSCRAVAGVSAARRLATSTMLAIALAGSAPGGERTLRRCSLSAGMGRSRRHPGGCCAADHVAPCRLVWGRARATRCRRRSRAR